MPLSFMDLDLKNKIVIVSGGARGIGAAISRMLSEENAIPVILDRNQKEGDKLVEELKNENKDAYFIQVELSKTTDCQMAVSQTVSRYMRIDGLINNAGINDGVGLESGDPESFRESLDKNLYHYYDLAHYCLPELKKNRGSIVNIASKVAVTGQGDTSGYAAAKGAQLALTREWAVELLKYKVRVNAILPAEVMTPLYEQWISTFENPEEKIQQIKQKIPLGKRMTTAEEIASMAVYLTSRQASHITGQHLFVDGGYVHLDRSLK